MIWVKLPQIDPKIELFGRIDNDGLMRVTAVREHPELLEWIEENGEPEDIQ
jgi:hypothetical protein